MSSLHVTDIKALAAEAHRDSKVREELFSAMLEGDGREANNAAWALTHLPDSDNIHINSHRDALVHLAVTTCEVPMRRLSLALLERLEWDVDDVRTDLLDFTLQRMIMNDEPYGVRALCVKLAYLQCRHYPELINELYQTLQMMERTDMGSGLKHARKKILMMIGTPE